MNADEWTRLGQRLFICLLCSAAFVSLFEPLLTYAINIIGLTQSPIALIGYLGLFTIGFYLVGYDDTVFHQRIWRTVRN